MKKMFLIMSMSLFLLSACGGTDVEPYIPVNKNNAGKTNIVYKDEAKALFDKINSFYKIKTGTYAGLYKENFPNQSSDPEHSYLWGYVGLLSGAALLQQLGYNIDYATLVNQFSVYYNTANNIGAYASSTNGRTGRGTRYYDDNAICGIEMVEAYNLLKDDTYLANCKNIVAFLKAGEDNIFDGGLWWNEDEKNIQGNGNSNKPTCANGYAVNFLLRYYKVCNSSEKNEVLNLAKRLYSWLKANLKDPEDNCYWNDKQANGTINKTKWTYNTGVMVSNGVLMYEVTGNQDYLTDAILSAEGGYNYFVRPRNGMALAYPDSDPWFNTKLLKAYTELTKYNKNAAKYIDTYVSFMNHAFTDARTQEGFYYEDWTGASPKRFYQLLTQDAALESLGLISIYKNEK